MKLRWHFRIRRSRAGRRKERVAAFRTVRDGIQNKVRSLAARLG